MPVGKPGSAAGLSVGGRPGKTLDVLALDLAVNQAVGHVEFLGALAVESDVLVSAQTKRGKNQPQGEHARKGQQRQTDGGAKERVKQAGRAPVAAEKCRCPALVKGDVPM